MMWINNPEILREIHAERVRRVSQQPRLRRRLRVVDPGTEDAPGTVR
jgi:hypothetical protein